MAASARDDRPPWAGSQPWLQQCHSWGKFSHFSISSRTAFGRVWVLLLLWFRRQGVFLAPFKCSFFRCFSDLCNKHTSHARTHAHCFRLFCAPSSLHLDLIDLCALVRAGLVSQIYVIFLAVPAFHSFPLLSNATFHRQQWLSFLLHSFTNTCAHLQEEKREIKK